MAGRLLAVSDLHVAFRENRALLESLRPGSDDDWLIVAGDVAERFADVEQALRLLSTRFARVLWAPGNHELWTHPGDPVTLRGDRRYRRLVEMCRSLGVATPEDPYPVWRGAGGPVTVAPLFVLYDYSFRAPGTATKEESLRRAHEAGVVCTDEYLLHPDPYPTPDAWCRARAEWTRRRLEALPPGQRTVLVNHWPLVREPTRILRHPEFAQWCGTELTADWHRRFRAAAVVYGHLHIPRVTWHDGVRFEEVSVGYPREWQPRDPREPLRPVLPAAVPPPPPPAAPAAAPAAQAPVPAAAPAGESTLLGALLPSSVAAAEAFADLPGSPADHLHPQERQVVDHAVPRRQREFATVRQCARRAAGSLGVRPVPLLPDRRGAPQWPEGVVGAMTHCEGYRAAAVARSREMLGVGIDAEPNEPCPAGVLDLISLEREREWVAAHARAAPGVRWDRLLFSAKESVFKVWYPLTRRELDFEEAHIEVDPHDGTFTARLLVPGPTVGGRRLDGFAGRWLCRDNLLVTAIALPATAPGHGSPAPVSAAAGRGRDSGGVPRLTVP